MRLPNGYGTVYKLSGKRRKPWIARKPYKDDSDSEKLKIIYKNIGYYKTKAEAIDALSVYNDNPYSLDGETFNDIYKKWSEEYFTTLSNASSVRTITAAYKHCKCLYDIPMKDIRVMQLEDTIKNADVGSSTKARIKSLFNLMYRYAMKHEIVNKDYAKLCDISIKRDRQKEIVPFTNEEIELLWNNLDIPFVDMILIGIYSGWRPQELAILKTKDIDFENNTMFGGLKTSAGKNRYVPIHSKILDLVKKRYNPDKEYLFNDSNCTQGMGEHLTYDKYRHRFEKVIQRLNMHHRPHETRHTFITKAKEYNVDEYILKLIVGHAIIDVTEKVYTHRTLEQLQNEMKKIE